MKPLRRNLNKILADSFEAKVRHEAECIIGSIDFSFICSVCTWHNVLEQFDRVSKQMQRIDMNISGVIVLLNDLNDFLVQYKENGYDQVIEEATIIAEENDIPVCFPTNRRGQNQLTHVLYICDVASESIQQRFEAINSHNHTWKRVEF